MGCGTSFAKILLIIFNIIFWLSGAALLGVGIWLLVNPTIINGLELLTIVSESGNLLKFAAYVFIGVGAFVLIVGFFGCCGAIKENRCMLGAYIFLLVLIMGLEIAGGVLAIIYKDKIQEVIDEKLMETFKTDYNTTTEKGMAFTEALNFVQVKLKCCGVTGPKDYREKSPALDYPIHCCKLQPEAMDKDPITLTDRDIADLKGCRRDVPGTRHDDPPSCCVLKPESEDNPIKSLTNDDAKDYAQCKAKLAIPEESAYGYDKGCDEVFKNWVSKHAIILIGVGIGIACLELFGFIFAVCLCRSIQDED